MFANIPTREELAILYDEGGLASKMAHRFGLQENAETQAVAACLVALHNEGAVDLFRIVENSELQRLEGTAFFMATRFFCQILPELEVSSAKLMESVQALVTRGGKDMAACEPNAAFRVWCTKHPQYAQEVIAAARDGDALSISHLTFALEALNAVNEARQIALTLEACRVYAVTALGRITDNDPDSRAKTFATFNSLIDSGADDNLCASLLDATLAIREKNPEDDPSTVLALLKRLVEDAGEQTVHQCAFSLWAHQKGLQPEIVAYLLTALGRLNPANKGTVQVLDDGLQSLLENGYADEAIAYVEQLFSIEDLPLRLEDFDSFANALISGPQERLGRVTAHWLHLGIPSLCQGLAEILQQSARNGCTLNLLAEDLATSPQDQICVCRRAIGWFFFTPTTAASVLVSVLRVCDAETAQKVQSLLVDPLLLNYFDIREYLTGLAGDDPAKPFVDWALVQNDSYLEGLRTVPLIKEFKPSEHHRLIERLRIADQSREMGKQIQSKSVFLSLMKQSVLLYGSSSLIFMKDFDGKLRSMETKLSSIGHSVEIPRMVRIDPVGLDYLLRVFKRMES